MNLRASVSTLLSSSCLLLAFGCSSEADPPGGVGGTGTTGGTASTAGASTTGGTGTGTAGTAPIAGAAPTGGTGTGTGGTGAGGTGTAGTGTGGTGTAGTGGTGAGGTGAGGSGSYMVPRGQSMGCGKDAEDEPGKFIKHDINVTGVDPAFAVAHPVSTENNNNGGYTYEKRNYFIKLPQGYDKNKPYPVTFGGGGCGNTNGLSGQGGGQQASGINAIQIGLSYVFSGGACFEEKYTNTPEVPYFDAVIADVKANYCVNNEKVFVGGYSSGAWESVLLGLARGGVVRGIATGAGGLRKDRPTPSGIPIAAILLTGKNDTTNPIDGPEGSALARDKILETNKCVGTATAPFAADKDCVQYTGCPAAFPVVWCVPNENHTGGSNEHWAAVGAFWDMLPAVP